ncbi:MAG: hypothetical protein M4579_004317 [Chaenotheca gracillima]|nr:MAG: hypothetical protein M4579_004317 [Chaenotheca gracillima]
MPPRGVKKQAANQHNHRHENGLAQPGKKIEKDRAHSVSKHKGVNGHLNGAYKPPASPTARPGQHPALGESSSDVSSSENRVEFDDGDRVGLDQGRRESESSEYVEDAFQNGTDSPALGDVDAKQEHHRQIDVNALHDTNGSKPQSRGAMEMLSTILRACPLGDSIAVLIILLQIPPTVLTVIHFLFATLTLIPQYIPSVAALPSLPTILAGSVAQPSLATTLTADVVFMIVWLFLWTPAQNFTVDFAQAAIAVSLGSGHAGRAGGTKNALICLSVILLCSAAKRKGFRLSGLSFFSSTLSSPAPTSTKVASFISQPESYITRSSHGWVRSILAVHITTQSIVRGVRGWLVARTRVSAQATSKKVDPEAGTPSQGQVDGKSAAEGASQGAGAGGDAQLPSSTPIPKPGKEKPQSNKKKRKKAIRVRNEQPIWAALASIKVNAMNSYEQSQATAMAVDSKATDTNNLGSATFNSQEGCIWVTHVGSTEIYFSTSLLSSQKDAGESNVSRKKSADDTADAPISVRVNGTLWTSISISRIGDDTVEGGEGGIISRWGGEVFGLAPASNYQCEFISSGDQRVIFSTTFTTQQASSSMTASSNPTAPICPKPLRPSSPTTTLKKSILAAESALQDEKTRQKRVRKDHKSHFNSLKKEVDSSNSRLSGSSGGDDRQRQRVLQLRQNIRQANEVTEETASEIDGMGPIPEEDTRAWEEAKDAWEEERQRFKAVDDHLKEEIASAERQVAAVEAEALTSNQKRERLQARLTKLQEQHDRIVKAQAQGLSHKEQMAAEHAISLQKRQAWERGLIAETGALQTLIRQTTTTSQGLWQQIHTIETAMRDNPQPLQPQLAGSDMMIGPHQGHSSPPGPHDARLVGHGPFSGLQAPLPGLSSSSLANPGPFLSRGRSGSIISNTSGPQEGNDVAWPSPPSGAAAPFAKASRAGRRVSHYSDEGSSSSASGSQRDPMSPTVKRGSPLLVATSSKSNYPWG